MNPLKKPSYFLSILLSALLLNCGGGSDSNITQRLSKLESDIKHDLDTYDSNVDFTFYVKSENENSILHSTGSSNEFVLYESASTSKLVTTVIILSLVNEGILSLDDNPQDYIATWPTTGKLSAIKLKHLLSFTSGLSNEPLCINAANFNFATCVDNIVNANPVSTIPGEAFYYASSHLQVAGLMAINASANTSWESVFSQFQSKTGLFLNSKYDLPSITNPRLAGGMHWTASDYMLFLEAIYKQAILTPSLINQLSSDQISGALTENSPALNQLGEDWHYGYGAWIECPETPYNCTQTRRISSPGAYGAYPFIDFEYGYYGIVARQGDLGTFLQGINLFRAVSENLENWASIKTVLDEPAAPKDAGPIN